jgi:hypothetical protein
MRQRLPPPVPVPSPSEPADAMTARPAGRVPLDAGERTYIVFDGPQPFIGAPRLDGRPIASARRSPVAWLTSATEHAALAVLGDHDWVDRLGPRSPM